MDLMEWIIIIIVALVLLSVFKPDIYDKTAGPLVNKGMQSIFGEDDSETVDVNTPAKVEVVDLGLPHTYVNATVFECTSDNICERLYGQDAFCRTIDGHCYK